MRRIFTTLGIVAVLSLGAAPTAFAAPGDQVCNPLSSGKIDTTGDPSTVTLVAPPGEVITGYCVKAGSANHGDGPVYVTLNEPVTTIDIFYPSQSGSPSGKAVSHYSYSVAPIEETPVDQAPIEEAPGKGTPGEETPGNGTPGEETPGNGTPIQGAPAQGPGAPVPAPEVPTRGLGAPVLETPAQGPGVPAAPAQATQSGQQAADGRAVTNQGLNVQSAGTDASPAQNPVVLGGILALLATAGIWALRTKLVKQ